MFNELNTRKTTVKAGINTRDLEFKPLKDFVGCELHVDGYFFTNGKYGKQVVVVANGYNINMPQRAMEQFEAIDKNDFMVKAILEGKLKLTEIAPITTKNGETTSYKLTDC